MNDLEAEYRYYECVIRLHELEHNFEIRGNGQNYTKGEHGRFTGSKPAGGAGKVSSKGLTNGAKSGIITSIKMPDIQIGRSLGAKAKNYDVMNLSTGEIFHFSEGTKIQNVEVFAGRGTNKELRLADKCVEKYGGRAEDWQHAKGSALLDYYGEDRKAEVHWVQCEGVGKHDFFIKRWLE